MTAIDDPRHSQSAPASEEGVEPVGAPELQGAQDVAAGLAHAIKACRIHGVNSATVATVVERLHTRLLAFFETSAQVSLAFSVLPDALCYKGHAVLELAAPGGAEPAFAAMNQAGIRQFALLDGLSRVHLGEFVELLVRCPVDATGFDLATLLWERDFDQISYLVVESFAEDLASPRFQEALNQLLTTVASELPVDTVRAARLSEDDLRIKPDSPFMDGGTATDPEAVFEDIIEQEKVTAALASGEDDLLGSRLVAIFLRLSQIVPEPERLALEENLALLWEDELAGGRLESARRAARLLAEWKTKMQKQPAGRTADGVLQRIATCKALERLTFLVEDPAAAGPRVADLLLALGSKALPAAYRAAKAWAQPTARAPMLECLTALAANDATFLIRELAANQAEAWRLCIPVLARLEQPAVEASLIDAFKRGSGEARATLLKAVAGRKAPFVRGLLVNALADEDPQVRVIAFRELGKSDEKRAIDALFAAAEKQLATERNSATLSTILGALVQADDVRGVQLLKKLASEPARHAKEVLVETARTLAKVPSPVTTQILTELGRSSGIREVALECEHALKRMSHGA